MCCACIWSGTIPRAAISTTSVEPCTATVASPLTPDRLAASSLAVKTWADAVAGALEVAGALVVAGTLEVVVEVGVCVVLVPGTDVQAAADNRTPARVAARLFLLMDGLLSSKRRPVMPSLRGALHGSGDERAPYPARFSMSGADGYDSEHVFDILDPSGPPRSDESRKASPAWAATPPSNATTRTRTASRSTCSTPCAGGCPSCSSCSSRRGSCAAPSWRARRTRPAASARPRRWRSRGTAESARPRRSSGAGKRYRVDALVQTWAVERAWWDRERRVSRRCFRVLARGGVYDLAFDRLRRGWLLVGVVD